ncbi:hypothetical protein MY10362_002778 [Beauveria mimosiformis]
MGRMGVVDSSVASTSARQGISRRIYMSLNLGQHRGFAVLLAAETLPEEEWNWTN